LPASLRVGITTLTTGAATRVGSGITAKG
jgi:hypothetical protein